MNKRITYLIRKIINQKIIVGATNKTNRETWLESRLKKIPNGSRILDAGAGELQYKKYCSHLDYVSQDFGQYNGDGDDKGLQTGEWDNSKLDIVSDIAAIPEPDKSFDAIMCIEVFEHLPNPIAAIKEFSRLIKDDGIIILTAPFCSLTHFSPYHFYTGFNRYFYDKYLVENNFEIIEISHNGNYFEYIAQELMRIPSCANKYSNMNISIFSKLAIFKLLFTLKILSKKDKGSDELLCFGLHIVAKKLSDKQ
jgi:ubiquinone/menaquinone biosynthesis C-methylase UbiE